MLRKPAQFEYRDEFVKYLSANGVIKTGDDYVSWMNSASKWLGRRIGPLDLSDEDDVQGLLAEVRTLDEKSPSKRLLTNQGSKNNLQSILRKYVEMVRSDYLGLFANVSAASAPVANDASTIGIPARVEQTVYRIVRDTEMSRKIKRLYEFQCQVCEVRLEIEPGVFYAEAHHLQPLGGEHKGPDVRENLLCLCPNHHALFDYFAFPLDPAHLKLNKHTLGQSFVDYHNARATKEGNFHAASL